MTVADLIAALKTYDAGLPVVAGVDGFVLREVDAAGLYVGGVAAVSQFPTARGTYRRRVTGRESEQPVLVIGPTPSWRNPFGSIAEGSKAA